MEFTNLGFVIRRPTGFTVIAAAAITAATCLSAFLYIQPILQHQNKPHATIVSRTREEAEKAGRATNTAQVPYPPDVFPGARDVETPYGTIKVFEWGPEEGEKVALLHGIGTPCIAMGDMASEFVRRGCRVILFDLFGRGYSDAPADLPYDDRLYTTQLLLALASSPLSWTGADAFHIVGYSLGGALAASVATYFPHMLKSATLVCPGGLIRPSHVSWRSRIVYSEGLLPEWLIRRWVRQRIAPQHGGSRADVPIDDDVEVDWDDVLLSTEGQSARIGDVMQWQLDGNPGLVMAYLSTIRNAPVYGHHDGLWRILSQKLLIRRQPPPGELPSGLRSGRICLVLATRDPVVAKDEWIEDSRAVLGEDGVDIHIVPGGHEIAITKGKQIADIAMNSWRID